MHDGTDEVRVDASGVPVGSDADIPLRHMTSADSSRRAHLSSFQALATPYAVWLSYVLLALGVALRIWQLAGAETDYDEGVYWQSLRALANGHPLFTSVFSSQPPVFLYSLYPFYLALGQSLTAARSGVVVYSLVGIAAIYVIGRLTAGHLAGLAAATLLALDPLYLQESRTLQAEVPALCLALVGIALAMAAWRSTGTRRHWLALASGLVIALGIGAKLFDVVALVPAMLYLAAPIGAATVVGDRILWPTRSRLQASALAALLDVAFLAAGLLLGTAIYVVPYLAVWPTFYDQVIRFHLAAQHIPNTGLSERIRVLANVGSEVPLELAALAALAVALSRRAWTTLPLVAWAAASLVLLLDQRPLFSHHVTLLVPPLVALVAIVATLLWQSGHARHASAYPTSVELPARAPILAVGAVTVLLVWGLGAGVLQARSVHGPTPRQLAVADMIAASTQPGDYVLADDQYLVALAGRDVPPNLVDTSTVRIESGYLTLPQLEQAAQDSNVREVLFASGRFDEVPGFKSWVKAHFTKIADFGNGTVLYARLPQVPSQAQGLSKMGDSW